jgi:hypothetical protein
MSRPKRLPDFSTGAALAALLAALAVFGAAPEAGAQRSSVAQTPAFTVDPLWPKPLPNHWVLGSVTGVAVDSQDHIWITHRGADSLGNNEKGAILNPPTGCCVPAPQVLEFDQAGNLVSHWGGPGEGFDWPQSTGGITIDHKANPKGARQDLRRLQLRPRGPQRQNLKTLTFSNSQAPANSCCRSDTPAKLRATTARPVSTGLRAFGLMRQRMKFMSPMEWATTA